jgi:ABC-2 type transport system permease protein
VRSPAGELTARALAALRRSTIWWALGIAALALVTVAFWPSLEGSDALTQLGDSSEDLLRAFGAQGIARPDGYLDGQLYALMLPLLLSGMAIVHVTGLTSGDEDAGRLELLHALPVGRRAVWLSRYVAVAVVLALVAGVTAALVAATLGPFSLDDVGIGRVVAATFACALLGAFHAAVGFLAGATGCRRGLAAGIAVLVLMVGYVLAFLAPLAEGLAGARRWSPWYWALGEQPVSDGVSSTRLLLLAGVTAVLVVAGLVAIERRDIHPA